MDRELMINEMEKDISLYKNFTCPDYPDLNIYSKEYMSIMTQIFNNAKEPFTLIYTDANKLSVVNERFGKSVGDNTLHSLLSIFTSNPYLKDSTTIRIGGDEFVTFVPGKNKSEVTQMLNTTVSILEEKRKELYGSGLSFGVEDSTSYKTVEELLYVAEYEAGITKNENNKNDVFLEETQSSEGFIDLPIPKNISDEQKQKWEILNTKINIAVDSHLRDLRPSSNTFEYKIPNVKSDIKQFITSFRNLLETNPKTISDETEEEINIDNSINISPESANIIHSLFEGSIKLDSLNDEQLQDVQHALNNFEKNLIRDSHSGLLNKAYFKLFLADKLLESKQNYQAICFSMVGIRPSNTAYGHFVTDSKIDKTISFLIDAIKDKCDFNNEAFSFDASNCFLVDQSGGNYIAYVPNNKSLPQNIIEEIVESVNSHFTDKPDSTFKVAYASKKNVNRFTIPFFTNSMNNVPNNPIEWSRTLFQVLKNRSKKNVSLKSAPYEEYLNKPFVKFSRKLEEICNDKKDKLKMDSLESDINEQSIETVLNDLINYYMENIENPNDIEAKKFLLNNTVLALANNEAYINKLTRERYEEKVNERKIFKNPSSRKISDNERE